MNREILSGTGGEGNAVGGNCAADVGYCTAAGGNTSAGGDALWLVTTL